MYRASCYVHAPSHPLLYSSVRDVLSFATLGIQTLDPRDRAFVVRAVVPCPTPDALPSRASAYSRSSSFTRSMACWMMALILERCASEEVGVATNGFRFTGHGEFCCRASLAIESR